MVKIYKLKLYFSLNENLRTNKILFQSENESTLYVKTSCNPGGNEKFQFSSPTCESCHLLRIDGVLESFKRFFIFEKSDRCFEAVCDYQGS